MSTIVYTSCPLKSNQQRGFPHYVSANHVVEKGCSRTRTAAHSRENVKFIDEDEEQCDGLSSRRSAIVSGVSLISSAVLGFPCNGLAVVKQGLLAGRVPGLSEPDDQGNAAGLSLILAPTITFKRIVANRSTEDFSGIPYVMTLLNCLLSAWYGLPFVSPNNIPLSIINGTGVAFESVYVLIFLIFAPRKERFKIFGLFLLVISVFLAVALFSIFALHGHRRKFFCGCIASVFSIIMYGSPLSAMRMVIKTKSVEFMPFFLSLFVFLSATSWFFYGLLERDPFLSVANGFGCGLGAVQLILYAIYRAIKQETKKAGADESLEMGLGKGPQLKQPNVHMPQDDG